MEAPYPTPTILTMPNPEVDVVIGPTASGKSAYAIDLALQEKGEVVSADARQVYRGFPVTTAQVTSEEMRGVPHYLLNIVDIEETYTAARFVQDAERAIATIHARGKRPIVAGGTMFYVDALIWEGYLPAPVPPQPKLREQWESLPTEAIVRLLAQRDPERARAIGLNRPRLIRALEIHETLGTIPRRTNLAPRYRVRIHLLQWPWEVLAQRIRLRVEQRIDAMLEEIEQQRHRLTPERARRLGFDWTLTLAYLEGACTREALIDALTRADMRYARRQMRWWKVSIPRLAAFGLVRVS
jgi:tRNA dimethylallyltransferase